MIKAKLNNGDLIFGLSKVNVERLQKGEPIAFNLKDMGLENRRVIIMYGETEEKMYEDMVDQIDLKTTKIHDEKPYRMIEGVCIEEEWMQFPDFPEPPDEKSIPTIESQNQWDSYRKALQEFRIKHKLK